MKQTDGEMNEWKLVLMSRGPFYQKS